MPALSHPSGSTEARVICNSQKLPLGTWTQKARCLLLAAKKVLLLLLSHLLRKAPEHPSQTPSLGISDARIRSFFPPWEHVGEALWHPLNMGAISQTPGTNRSGSICGWTRGRVPTLSSPERGTKHAGPSILLAPPSVRNIRSGWLHSSMNFSNTLTFIAQARLIRGSSSGVPM